MENKTSKRKQVIIIAVIAAAAAALILALLLASGSKARDLSKQLGLGKRYLEEMDYDNALIAFNRAIEIDPKCEDAYIGAADAYIGKGGPENAEKILKKGLENVPGSELMKKKLEELTGEEMKIETPTSAARSSSASSSLAAGSSASGSLAESDASSRVASTAAVSSAVPSTANLQPINADYIDYAGLHKELAFIPEYYGWTNIASENGDLEYRYPEGGDESGSAAEWFSQYVEITDIANANHYFGWTDSVPVRYYNLTSQGDGLTYLKIMDNGKDDLLYLASDTIRFVSGSETGPQDISADFQIVIGTADPSAAKIESNGKTVQLYNADGTPSSEEAKEAIAEAKTRVTALIEAYYDICDHYGLEGKKYLDTDAVLRLFARL